MPYNPNIHHRKSIRLKGYDYSQEGLYFITICVKNRKCLFGNIVDDEMIFNEYGTIAHHQWQQLPARFPNMELDVFQIMPNHMHGIISLTVPVGATLAVAPDNETVADGNKTVARDNDTVAEGNKMVFPDNDIDADSAGAGASPAPAATNEIKSKTIGDIVGAYKSLVANDCLEIFKQKQPGERMGKLWQRNYWDHIIRDEQSYQRISEYIRNNVKNWRKDKFHIE